MYSHIEFWMICFKIIKYCNTLFQYGVKNILEIALIKWTHQLLQPILVIFKLCFSLVKQINYLFELLFVLFFYYLKKYFLPSSSAVSYASCIIYAFDAFLPSINPSRWYQLRDCPFLAYWFVHHFFIEKESTNQK